MRGGDGGGGRAHAHFAVAGRFSCRFAVSGHAPVRGFKGRAAAMKLRRVPVGRCYIPSFIIICSLPSTPRMNSSAEIMPSMYCC